MENCVICQKEFGTNENNSWYLKYYFGISGTVCQACMDKIRHDGLGKPIKPRAYLNALKKYREGIRNDCNAITQMV